VGRRKSKLILLLALMALAWGIAHAAAQPIEDFLFDVVVTYRTADGLEVVAVDGFQVTGDLKIYVYTNQPGKVSITATAGGEKIFETEEGIEFKKEYSLTVPPSKYGRTITITVVLTWGKISKSVIKSYTVVKKPIPPAEAMAGWLTPKQLEKIVANIKWETIMKAMFAALMGIGAAAFLKYYLMMVDPINALQIPVLASSLAAAYLLEPEYGSGYWMVFLLADLLSYRFLKGPALIGILELRSKEREAWDVLLPIYTTADGRLAIALQRSDWAIRRLLGRHVYLELKNPVEAMWKKNGSIDLIIAEKAELKQKEVAAKHPEEATEGLRLEKIKRKEWVFEVEVADAHTIEFLKKAAYFDELKKHAKRILEENRKLYAQLDLAVEEAKTKAIMDWAKMRGVNIE